MSKNEIVDDAEEEGTRHFMVNVVEPQFNLHAEDANVSFQASDVDPQCIVEVFEVDTIHYRGDSDVVYLQQPVIELYM